MERGSASGPDWRDAAAYAPLHAADRTILAWEWLRRDAAYRAAALAAAHTDSDAGAATWGLHRLEHPDRAAPMARPVWTLASGAMVLPARATHGRPDAGYRTAAFAPWSTVVADGPGPEHLLLSDGLRAIRCDLTGASVRLDRLLLTFAVSAPPMAAGVLRALRAFDALARTGRFAPALHPAPPRVHRQVLLLRTADALAAGADQRAIAAALLDPAAARRGWRDVRPELRQQAQRLVRDARALAAGGYRSLLCGG